MAEEQRFKRLYPRRQVIARCLVSCPAYLFTGKVVDVSYNGVGILFPEVIDMSGEASVEISEGIRLRVRPVYNQPVSTQQEDIRYRVGCKIQLIEEGKRAWSNLCHVVHW
ncbi:MAG TPA: PilZ domain-containing protein [Nitrospiraceae bacterium]|jgi:hypothetical protein|nr:PilZ domain-containing protein [Nitrospiraceae bacterium]